MKKLTLLGLVMTVLFCCAFEEDCNGAANNRTALREQAATEENQSTLFKNQPPPRLTWSLERDNLIKRFKLQNDRSVNFFMYVFIEGVADPVGYYLVNKVDQYDADRSIRRRVFTCVTFAR